MVNPFLKYARYFILYISVWILLSIVQIILLSFSDYSLNKIILDVIINNNLFALLGLIVWYPVYFSNLDKKPLIIVLLTHLASMTVVILIWTHLGLYILTLLCENDPGYVEFLNRSHVMRNGIGVFFYVILVLIYYLIIYYSSFQEKLLKESDLKTLVKESELASLKSQINPHFLFNSLNSVSSLTISNPERAQEMIIKLSEFLRYSLGKDQKEKTTLKSEIENIQRYLDIEKTRFDEKLDLKIVLNKNCESALLPNMILQPLIENAIKHGVYENTDKTEIEIDCYSNEDYLEIFIRNNFDPDAVPRKGTGLGLKNISHRLGILYSRNDLIRINRENNIFEVRILIPQEKNKKEKNDKKN